ncbi:hypothetical protein BDZ94DRAFT_553245 [Collybia nuda]|uniref:Uncharacterized protein n=1 Tax=Collybia nuda TaxID=64659 RepID=A0A9P5YHT1_9AGAR|nr:hypothetical protein BDZ94DRAFT_553245 [Collybia nuda]
MSLLPCSVLELMRSPVPKSQPNLVFLQFEIAWMDAESSHTFTILFEEDIENITATECIPRTSPFSRLRKTETQSEVADDLDDIFTEKEVKDSYMSAVLSTIQPLDPCHALLILNITCHPSPRRRFVDATINLHVSPQPLSSQRSSFDPSPSPESSPNHGPSPLPRSRPKIVGVAPEYSLGGWTEEQTTFKRGVALPIAVGFGPASIGVTPSVEKETQKFVMHAMAIIGSLQQNMRCAHWTVVENHSSEGGIPPHFQVATVVEHTGPFMVKFDVKARLGGGRWLPTDIVSRGRGGKSLKKIIDVQTWRRGEIDLRPGEEAWRTFLAGLTGEVPGSTCEFGQRVVRS